MWLFSHLILKFDFDEPCAEYCSKNAKRGQMLGKDMLPNQDTQNCYGKCRHPVLFSNLRTSGARSAHATATVMTAMGNVVAKYTRMVSKLIADNSCILKIPDTTLNGMKNVASQVRRPILRASLMALRDSSTAITAVTTLVSRSIRVWYSSRYLRTS